MPTGGVVRARLALPSCMGSKQRLFVAAAGPMVQRYVVGLPEAVTARSSP
jgi:hypothetical protein